ncbi:LysR substrate-binding domain-containing protein [Kitasatospora sp. NBC_01266]|uniref:LysR substrate-binding domain-containing protein n=1 Tax=Kitasatospora sp. NBC_01266 TaxID=2903572 RepID=UPI002E2F3211|nr:LysR substrate-binding domain-containing protein [Kitasatospora sp. NBC_01266]
MDCAELARYEHLLVPRSGRLRSALDPLLAEAGVRRTVSASLPDFAGALRMVAAGNAVTVAPAGLVAALGPELGVCAFELPMRLKPLRISRLWHPRQDGEPGHRWLRDCVRELAQQVRSAAPGPAAGG